MRTELQISSNNTSFFRLVSGSVFQENIYEMVRSVFKNLESFGVERRLGDCRSGLFIG